MNPTSVWGLPGVRLLLSKDCNAARPNVMWSREVGAVVTAYTCICMSGQLGAGLLLVSPFFLWDHFCRGMTPYTKQFTS